MGISAMNSSINNNRKLKNRRGFFESFKKMKRKFKLKKHDNSHLTEMTENEILILREKLETEQRTSLIFSILGIVILVISVLMVLNNYLNNYFGF